MTHGSEQRTYSQNGVICPYCGVEDEDAWESVRGEDAQDKVCGSCDKTYEAWASYEVTYYASAKDEQQDRSDL